VIDEAQQPSALLVMLERMSARRRRGGNARQEDTRQLVRRDAAAVVNHTKAQPFLRALVARGGCARDIHIQPHVAARGRELNAVGK
jgi:hypothetical protein